jgi:hypothetical protein
MEAKSHKRTSAQRVSTKRPQPKTHRKRMLRAVLVLTQRTIQPSTANLLSACLSSIQFTHKMRKACPAHGWKLNKYLRISYVLDPDNVPIFARWHCNVCHSDGVTLQGIAHIITPTEPSVDLRIVRKVSRKLWSQEPVPYWAKRVNSNPKRSRSR